MKNFWTTLPRPIVALAPMEGVTDSAFRQICREQGADVVYTEFISSDAIGHRGKTALAKMEFDPTEQPVICQIFGRDVAMFREAAKEIEARGFAGIDINFGCPAKKVVGSGSGVALLREPRFCRQLIEAILDVVTIPVSIKVRASIRKERKEVQPGAERATALDLVREIKDLPIAAVMVHGRSYEGGFTGTVDVDMIASVKAEFPGVVLANGGIQTPQQAIQMLRDSGADGVGIARGAQGQPWIFNQIKALLTSGSAGEIQWSHVRSVALNHARLAMERKADHGLLEMRKHLAWYVRGFPGAAQLRYDLVRVKSLNEIERLLKQTPP
jgi:tRNA-dihydrouridine synthase B